MSPLAFAWRGLVRQPGRAFLGIAGIAATGALLLDMLMLSQGLVVSMERLLTGTGFDIRVTATQANPLAGPPITNIAKTVAELRAISAVEEVVPLRLGSAEVDLNGRTHRVVFMGADAVRRRPWTVVQGSEVPPSGSGFRVPGSTFEFQVPGSRTRNPEPEPEPGTSTRNPEPGTRNLSRPAVLVNRHLARRWRLTPGATLTLLGACTDNSSVPPVEFHVAGIAEFPFDQARQLTAVTSLENYARTCGDVAADEADMLMVASRADAGSGAAVDAIRSVRPDLGTVTNEELVARFQQVEFSYFRQVSVVLATITMFFGLLLITVLLSVSTNQRLGEIAALRALGFSRRRMVSDVLWRSALLVGIGGLLAVPLGLAMSRWLDALLKTMPGIPENLRFFVLEPRAAIVYVVLLVVTMAAAAIYPIRTVARLPISGTLRSEVIG